MSKNTVSLCMIVKDEETYIRRCLDSVSNLVDEIIIVDTGSTDSTLSIAAEYGAKILKFTWQEDFAIARNFSIENAISDYILVLDADEYIDQDINLQESIKDMKDYYIINFKNYMDGGYISTHQSIRLFKNNIGLKYYGKIHEHLNIDDFDNLSVAFTDFFIHHDGYKNDVFNQKNKFERNLKILEKEVKSNPTGYNLFNLGTQYKVGKEYLKALEQFKKSYSLSKNQMYLPYLLYSMGDCLLQLGRNKEGITLMKDSIELFPKYTGFYYLIGLFFENMNFYRAAEEAFEKCLELGEVENFQSIEGVGSYFAYIKLSELQQKQGNLLKALESSFSAIKLNKNFPPALSQYISVLKSAGITESDIKENLVKSYPINDVKKLEILTGVLYAHRNKLLQVYIDGFNINVNNSVLAIAALYNNEYEKAYTYWNKEEILDKRNYSDIITLLTVQKNQDLLEKLLKAMNLNKKEKKAISSIVEKNEDILNCLPDTLFETIKDVCVNLLTLGEKKVFIDLFKRLNLNELKKVQLIRSVINKGYLNVAINLITEELKINNKNYELIGLLGDAYARQNKYQEALGLYTQLIENVGDYSSYNRLFCLYEKINYSDGLPMLKVQMKRILETELGINIISY
ncbi:glycosyltransferase [Cytobacillus sp.]|uniref:glycosyltransferase n=1 Tax=Cytobacillus sp. TaxID=2675269 RepID=UPI0028BEBE36|nr:glycosyltransferase [Cytobacillus sp.]